MESCAQLSTDQIAEGMTKFSRLAAFVPAGAAGGIQIVGPSVREAMAYDERPSLEGLVMVEQKIGRVHETGEQAATRDEHAVAFTPYREDVGHEHVGHRMDDGRKARIEEWQSLGHVGLDAYKRQAVGTSQAVVQRKLTLGKIEADYPGASGGEDGGLLSSAAGETQEHHVGRIAEPGPRHGSLGCQDDVPATPARRLDAGARHWAGPFAAIVCLAVPEGAVVCACVHLGNLHSDAVRQGPVSRVGRSFAA